MEFLKNIFSIKDRETTPIPQEPTIEDYLRSGIKDPESLKSAVRLLKAASQSAQKAQLARQAIIFGPAVTGQSGIINILFDVNNFFQRAPQPPHQYLYCDTYEKFLEILQGKLKEDSWYKDSKMRVFRDLTHPQAACIMSPYGYVFRVNSMSAQITSMTQKVNIDIHRLNPQKATFEDLFRR